MSSTTTKDVYLVVGGSGFLGRHIVQALLARGDSVSVFDIVQRYHDTPFFSGDIAEDGAIANALEKVRFMYTGTGMCAEEPQSGATCIIHTASPMHGVKDDALYWRVNVDGTRAVIAAAQARGVAKLVFTSSAGIVFSGASLVNVDERAPAPERAMDAYNESKGEAEKLVLAANGVGGLLTVALRPAGIFGCAPACVRAPAPR
jgi:sterol-4alpha-carboxylate 3-dehydrogenase (decarboxylating)